MKLMILTNLRDKKIMEENPYNKLSFNELMLLSEEIHKRLIRKKEGLDNGRKQ